MIPAAFEYHRPASVSEALQLLQRLSDAKLLAGGHSLLPMMKLRLTSPAHLIDLGRIEAMRYIRQDGQMLVIGALTTHWGIESSQLVQTAAPALAEAAGRIGDVQVRNVGTIGGSLAHADPAADYPAAMLALDGQIIAESRRGRRTIPAAEFFTGIFTTTLAPDEVLVEVRVPATSGRMGQAYLKFAHPASGFAVVGVAAVITRDGGGRCTRARIGITGVGPAAYHPTAVEDQLVGSSLDEKGVAATAAHAADGVDVNEDLFASAEYRAHLARVFTKRAVLAAAQRAG
jgi:aerobic carbon-monoxide dehydrogenase medium subunit